MVKKCAKMGYKLDLLLIRLNYFTVNRNVMKKKPMGSTQKL